MSRYNKCGDCYNMKCIFVTGERTDFDSSKCADFRPMTNADRIRQMSDEELAEYLIADIEAEAIRSAGRFLSCAEIDCAVDDCLSWLKAPVEVDG